MRGTILLRHLRENSGKMVKTAEDGGRGAESRACIRRFIAPSVTSQGAVSISDHVEDPGQSACSTTFPPSPVTNQRNRIKADVRMGEVCASCAAFPFLRARVLM